MTTSGRKPYVEAARLADFINGIRRAGPSLGVELAELEATIIDLIATYRGASYDPENAARAQELERIKEWFDEHFPEPPARAEIRRMERGS